METCHFKCTSLSDSWFTLIFALMKGEVPREIYEINKGSYVGQKRLEFQHVTIQIDHPGVRPLIPEIPPHLNIPPPVADMDYIEGYFAQYLMNPEIEENETYKYATWLAPGVERVIEQLKGAPGNNQAAISIGGWATIPNETDTPDNPALVRFYSGVDTDNIIDPATGQRDPACLRVVDFRLDQKNTLHMFVYFRSWCLYNGYPANLAGLQLVKEYVAQAIGAKDGRIIASSKGLHLYDHAIQVAAQRIGLEDVSTMEEFLSYIGKRKNDLS